MNAERLTTKSREVIKAAVDTAANHGHATVEPWHLLLALLDTGGSTAAALLRTTDHSVAEICFSVGLQSVGSFTSSFTRTYGVSPTAYRAAFPPAALQARIPTCVLRVYGRPQRRTFREDSRAALG